MFEEGVLAFLNEHKIAITVVIAAAVAMALVYWKYAGRSTFGAKEEEADAARKADAEALKEGEAEVTRAWKSVDSADSAKGDLARAQNIAKTEGSQEFAG